jgi:hypothetical protein
LQNAIVKLPKYKDLATYLCVSEQAVKQYPKAKRELMLIGLKYKTVWIDDTKKPKPDEVVVNG